MTDIEGLLSRLTGDELAELCDLGQGALLPGHLIAALDRAAGGPGEGRGYYVSAHPPVRREFLAYTLRPDVFRAVALHATAPSGGSPLDIDPGPAGFVLGVARSLHGHRTGHRAQFPLPVRRGS